MYLKYKYGLKKIFSNKINKKLMITIILLFLIVLLVITMFIKAQPLIVTLCNNKARSIAFIAANDVINNNLSELSYDNLVTLDKDSNGYVKALKINVMQMNKLSAKINKEIQEKLDTVEETTVNVKIGSFINKSMFSGFGPSFKLKVIPSGGVSTEFKTEFVEAGINQTRHRVYLKIKTRARIITPFLTKLVEVENNLDVAETVIVGDVPETYYNLQGIKDFDVNDTTNFAN